MRLRTLTCCLMLLGCSNLLLTQEHWAVSGTIVSSSGVLDNGVVIIDNGRIRDVGVNVFVPQDVPVLKVDGIVFPGLIDLHNHLISNVFPRWKLPASVSTRYDWQATPDFAKRLHNPQSALISHGFGCDMERYAEIKALAGGATSVTGSFGPTQAEPNRNQCVKGLARNLDMFSGLYADSVNAEPVRYETFPFEISWQQAQAIRDGLRSGELKAAVFHVSEGRDSSALREFRMLKARGFLRAGVTIIHGIALRETEFREMAANGVGLVWSPRSNLELYGQTVDIAAAKAARLTIALAPDWSLTGSSNILEELHFAYMWDSHHSVRLVSDSELFQMVTSNPALLVGVSDKIGRIAPGMMADLIVLPRHGIDVLSALVNFQPGSIELVVVGGRPLLGRQDYMHKLLPSKKLELMRICGREKALYILDDTESQSFASIAARLEAAMQSVGTDLAPLSDCSN